MTNLKPTFDFLNPWDELSNEEQWNWEEDCKTRATKAEAKACKRFGYYFNMINVTWNSKEEWYFRHMDAKQTAEIQSHWTPEYKMKLQLKEEEKQLKRELAVLEGRN